MVELLSPVGDFECLEAAVQAGCNAVYFAAKSFGARAYAGNFNDDELNHAINYAKLRGVKTHLTLNTLIKQEEFEDAFHVAEKAYQYGIDAIIVQDIGLATKLIESFPDLDIHASTQMTVHNLEGVNFLKKLGFKRVVLSRELSYDEIKYICDNTDMEIEVFVHGALCISYSGQCLFSSMIGGRSGNRGKCAQTCRLPYELLEEKSSNKVTLNEDGSKSIQNTKTLRTLDKGYLLSTRDLCSLEYLPKLIEAGATSFKIEGRMKSPEYVSTVTRIYRKYIDLAVDKSKDYIIDKDDLKDLMQVFNRGGFSEGHLPSKENRNLVFNEKSNNMGLYLGTISKYNKNKGLVTCKLQNNLSIGDSISFENENTKYTISELMLKNDNIKKASCNQEVTFGRMKGNIHLNDKIYKITDKELSDLAISNFSKENFLLSLDANLKIKQNEKLSATILCDRFNISVHYEYDFVPQLAQSQSLNEEKVINQFNRTGSTPFYFKHFNIDLDNDLFIPTSILNDFRRLGLQMIEDKILASFKRKVNENKTLYNLQKKSTVGIFNSSLGTKCHPQTDLLNENSSPQLAVLLNILNKNFDYHLLADFDKLYVPLKYFGMNNYLDILKYFADNFNLYIYMPTVIKKNYSSTAKSLIQKTISKLKIKGFVISNLSQLELIPLDNDFDVVGNYTLNVYNTFSSNFLNTFNFSTVTISPELDEDGILSFCNSSYNSKELIVYGNIPVMHSNYCPLGKSNHCYKECSKKCMSNSKFYLKDRMGICFRLILDNLQTISTIYNSKITSIEYKDFNINVARIDILDENIDEINKIIETVKNGNRFEGKDYTNGNLKREI